MSAAMLLMVVGTLIADAALELPGAGAPGMGIAGALVLGLAAAISGRLGAIPLRLIQASAVLLGVAVLTYRGHLGMEAAGTDVAALAIWNRTTLHVALVMATYAAFSLDEPVRTVPVLIIAAAAPLELRFSGIGLGLMLLALVISLGIAGIAGLFFRKTLEKTLATQYDLVKQIGGGGMGEVWLARHRSLARLAALKIIRPALLCGSDREEAERLVQRFELEAQATAQLRSPNTVEVYDFGTTPDGIFYYVMEYLEGIDLEQLVEEHGAVSPERALFWLQQACDSLAEAHSQGLVHRDIKPANLHVGCLGLQCDYLKVLDFGLVKTTTGPMQMNISAANTLAGTPAYVSPEQVTGDSQPDARSDIYALGCVAYWLLTGGHVFETTNPMKMIVAHVSEAPVAPSTRTEIPIPQCVDDLVLKCLAKEPVDRYQSAAELRDALAVCAAEATDWTAARAKRWWTVHHPGPAASASSQDATRA
jgi:serine/threonine protein kinase